MLGSITYWVLGWAVAYGKGGNSFIGGSNYLGLGMEQDDYPLWFFKFVFAATAATIVSGAIAERCQFGAYLIYSICITGEKTTNANDFGYNLIVYEEKLVRMRGFHGM